VTCFAPDNIDDDDFVESTVASYLKTAGSFVSTDTQYLLKSASSALVNGVSDGADKGIATGAKTQARMESMHLLDLGVGLLSTRGSGGWLDRPVRPLAQHHAEQVTAAIFPAKSSAAKAIFDNQKDYSACSECHSQHRMRTIADVCKRLARDQPIYE
jgi:hypothetical protein